MEQNFGNKSLKLKWPRSSRDFRKLAFGPKGCPAYLSHVFGATFNKPDRPHEFITLVPIQSLDKGVLHSMPVLVEDSLYVLLAG